MVIRDYEPKDFLDIKRIHEESGIQYKLPDMTKEENGEVVKAPLWLVTKVVEDNNGVVRMGLGAWITIELYLWLDKSNWATPQEKHLMLTLLQKAVLRDCYFKGVNHATLWLPPNMERFGQRLIDDFGFSRLQDGWMSYSKATERW